jgi:uncharacterized repeat protein (TIGR03843 family)
VHADDERLRRLAVLDVVINNGDRKGGHLLPAPEGRLFGIDHGVTFNAENKLRTLLWGWAGEKLTPEAVEVLERLRGALDGTLGVRLGELITAAELDATRARVAGLLASGGIRSPRGSGPRSRGRPSSRGRTPLNRRQEGLPGHLAWSGSYPEHPSG